MARDPLQVLLAIRQRAVEQARYALATCLTTENTIAGRIRALDAAVQKDRQVGATWPDAHQFLEMSAARLEVVRAERQAAGAELAAATTRSADARGVVVAARTAAEAVERLMSAREAANLAEAVRREQHVLDDIARARPPLQPRG